MMCGTITMNELDEPGSEAEHEKWNESVNNKSK
jgi:hypothetical protein